MKRPFARKRSLESLHFFRKAAAGRLDRRERRHRDGAFGAVWLGSGLLVGAPGKVGAADQQQTISSASVVGLDRRLGVWHVLHAPCAVKQEQPFAVDRFLCRAGSAGQHAEAESNQHGSGG
ncbi:MAG: hypothetical protein ACOX1P_32935 [Thermoguttaceae bacterium]